MFHLKDHTRQQQVFLFLLSLSLFPLLSGAVVERVPSSHGKEELLCCNYTTAHDEIINPASLDKDLALIRGLFSHDDWYEAKAIYTLGGHAVPFASVQLLEETSVPLQPNTRIRGMDYANQREVYGVVMEPGPRAQAVVHIEYDPHFTGQGNGVDIMAVSPCRIGALPGDKVQVDGCFASQGTMIAENESGQELGRFKYRYDPLLDNHNAFSLQKMVDASPPHYPAQYANEWIVAALDGRATNFGPQTGVLANFQGSSKAEQSVAVRLGILLMGLTSHVLDQLELAVQQCTDGTAMEASVLSWDTGFAFYTGSLEDGTGSGEFLYAIAQDQEGCGTDHDMPCPDGSIFNENVIRAFRNGQSALKQGSCQQAKMELNTIASLLTTLQVQGTIRLTYRMHRSFRKTGKVDSMDRTRAASYATALLPKLNSCNAHDASRIYEYLRLHPLKEQPDLEFVLVSLDENYECLGIEMQHVLDFLDPIQLQMIPDRSQLGPWIIGGCLMGLGLFMIAAPLLQCKRPQLESLLSALWWCLCCCGCWFCCCFGDSAQDDDDDGNRETDKLKGENLEDTLRTQNSEITVRAFNTLKDAHRHDSRASTAEVLSEDDNRSMISTPMVFESKDDSDEENPSRMT